MSDAELVLVERAAARGLIPAEAVVRARRECRGPAAEWLLDEKLLTREQLSRLIEDELPLLPRAAAKDMASKPPHSAVASAGPISRRSP